jgi:hypothetical protein
MLRQRHIREAAARLGQVGLLPSEGAADDQVIGRRHGMAEDRDRTAFHIFMKRDLPCWGS